ncbi:hypothetical protein Clacol_009947 [Clathrus columnatus]|uniref:Fungal-type protein kinase domain-containing protein n=1 Tax=Clathrus columnatus TaxID=1419009 RepID=A0AAV5ASD3_9AGAM|nr:hypothetical protein Clacol_009947 [Clathrus columnatus]
MHIHTRTFIAYSTSRQYNVFLKDSWRLDSQAPEHEIYAKLHANNVPHLPVLAGNDIFNQTTLTQDVLRENPIWVRVQPKPLRKHRHYRLILKEIAIPLTHSAAFKAGILHRDISSGNIMIYNNGGLLIDWDLSKSTKDSGARKSERTGTWRFIACRLVEDPTAVQGLTDDVESFIHVLTWVSFRYAKHNLTDERVDASIALIFDHAYYEKGLAKGGHAKINHLNFPSQLMKTEFENPSLKTLLTRITKTISFRYRTEPSLEDADDDEATLDRLLNVYRKRLGTLNNSEWIINELASALKLPNWPANDEAKKFETTQIARSTTHTRGQFPLSSLKRKSSEDVEGKNKKSRALSKSNSDIYFPSSR